jgi:hypothetical protein
MPTSRRHLAGSLLALGLALSGPAEVRADPWWARPAPPAPFDPFRGMDPSGRIPKVPFPADLPEPTRWRYIPEGRIKPGSVVDRFLVTSFVAPQVFFESDVGLGGGLALTDIDFRNQRRREFLGAFLTYTTEGQQSYRLLWRRWLYHRDLAEGGVVLEERSFVGAGGGYEKTLTRRFFGLGPDTREADETSYTDEVLNVGFGGEISLPGPGGAWVVGLGLGGEHHNLAPGRVSGRPTTDQVFPDLFEAADNYDAFTVSAGLRYDSRDSQHQPHRGWRIGVTLEAPVWQSTGDPAATFGAYANVVIPVPPLLHRGGDPDEENPPVDTVAIGAQVLATAGTLPYFARPSLGGANTLRGYIQNRFTGDAAWHAVAEYRFWVIPRGFRITRTIRIERVGLAPFVEAGTVADSLGDLPEARIHASYGVGVRVSLERIAMFRLDFGFSEEGFNFTAGFGLSF